MLGTARSKWHKACCPFCSCSFFNLLAEGAKQPQNTDITTAYNTGSITWQSMPLCAPAVYPPCAAPFPCTAKPLAPPLTLLEAAPAAAPAAVLCLTPWLASSPLATAELGEKPLWRSCWGAAHEWRSCTPPGDCFLWAADLAAPACCAPDLSAAIWRAPGLATAA